MAKSIGEYPWSSHYAYLGRGGGGGRYILYLSDRQWSGETLRIEHKRTEIFGEDKASFVREESIQSNVEGVWI